MHVWQIVMQMQYNDDVIIIRLYRSENALLSETNLSIITRKGSSLRNMYCSLLLAKSIDSGINYI